MYLGRERKRYWSIWGGGEKGGHTKTPAPQRKKKKKKALQDQGRTPLF